MTSTTVESTQSGLDRQAEKVSAAVANERRHEDAWRISESRAEDAEEALRKAKVAEHDKMRETEDAGELLAARQMRLDAETRVEAARAFSGARGENLEAARRGRETAEQELRDLRWRVQALRSALPALASEAERQDYRANELRREAEGFQRGRDATLATLAAHRKELEQLTGEGSEESN